MKILLTYYRKQNETAIIEDETLAFAARELADYLTRMLPRTTVINQSQGSCEKADLSIFLTVSPTDKPEEDSFRIHIQKETGEIVGSNSRSVLLAVYHYLHTLGCRFLAPGKQYEVIPAITEDQLYVSYAKKASFRHRGACIEGSNSLENVLDFIDWLPKLGYNSFFLQFRTPYIFLGRWYHHENNPSYPQMGEVQIGEVQMDETQMDEAKMNDAKGAFTDSPDAYTLEDAIAHTALMEQAMKLRGLHLHKVGHGWTGETLGFSTVAWEAVDADLTEEQQEMAAQLQGVRQLFWRAPANTNLCYSNPKAIETFSHLVADYACEHPDVAYLHVWLADASNNICECDACRKSTPSDQYIDILNHIDELLTQRGSQTRLVFLLYQELLWPPVKSRIKNPDRFVLMFAPISRTFEESYDLGKLLPQMQPYVRNQINPPTSLGENLTFLHGWQEQFSGDSFVYDYHLGRAHYGDLGYVHISRIASEDIKKLHEMGLNGMISCQELRACMPNALPNYVMGHTLFEEAVSFDALLEEYYRAAYGDDYEQVIHYLQKLSELSSCDYMNGKGPRKNPAIAQRMQEVLQAASDFQPTIDKHLVNGKWDTPFWRLLSYHRQYVEKLGSALFFMADGQNKNASLSWQAFRELICRMEPDFQEALDVYRVTEISGNYAGLKHILG